MWKLGIRNQGISLVYRAITWYPLPRSRTKLAPSSVRVVLEKHMILGRESSIRPGRRGPFHGGWTCWRRGVQASTAKCWIQKSILTINDRSYKKSQTILFKVMKRRVTQYQPSFLWCDRLNSSWCHLLLAPWAFPHLFFDGLHSAKLHGNCQTPCWKIYFLQHGKW